MVRRIFTLGTSNRTAEEFLALLNRWGIRRIVDVRRFPTSKFEHFKKENLESLLKAAGFEYKYFGDKLGGFRSGGYEAFAQTEQFSQALSELEEIASAAPTAVVCAERFPWRCHRRYIGFALADRGWDVVHVIDEQRTWRPRQASPSLPEFP